MSRWIGAVAAIAGALLAAAVWVRRLRLFKVFRLAHKALAVPSALRGARR
jgi:hypothetical protein